MLVSLLRVVGVDLEQQVHKVTAQVGWSAKQLALTIGLAFAGGILLLAALAFGAAALYHWIDIHYGPYAAMGCLGGLCLVLALILFTIAFERNTTRAPRQTRVRALTRPVASVDALTTRAAEHAAAIGEKAYDEAIGAVEHGSRKTLIIAISAAALVGLIIGRRI